MLVPISPAQIGQYHSKVLPAYIGPQSATKSAGASPSHGGTTRRAGTSSSKTAGDTFTTFKDAGSSALQVAKAWESGQRAARHFLAARAYFAPFEHGPTSVILALDLCKLYLFLAEMGATAAGGGGGGGRAAATTDPSSSSASSADSRDGMDSVVPIPSLSGRKGAGEKETIVSSRSGLATMVGEGGEVGADNRLRPTAAVRFQCLEGALRSLLDTQSVFADADIDLTVTAAAEVVASQPQHRLTRLLESVIERLPKVLQALVHASVALESSLSPSLSSSSSSSSTSAFKSMYRTSLMALRGGGEGGAHAVLARLAKEYEVVGQNEAVNDK